MNHNVSITKCESYDINKLKNSIRSSIDLLGGLEKYIKKSDRVLIKPNLLSARKPEQGVTTHPEFVKAVIELVKEAGGIPFLGDSPSGLINDAKLKKVYKATGMDKVCKDTGTQFVSLEDDSATYENENGKMYKSFSMSPELRNFDAIISLPKMKTHNMTLLTAAVKNNYGFVPGLRKAELHIVLKDIMLFSNMLLDVVETIKPTLIITDGVVSMEGQGGPSGGDLRNSGLIIAGTNASALDYIVSKIMDYDDFMKVPTLKAAFERELFVPEKVEVLGEKLEDVVQKDFKKVSFIIVDQIPNFLVNWIKNLISPKPAIIYSNCTKCGDCVEICPAKTIHKDSDNRPIIEYSECIRCFCCKETCTHSAIESRKSLLIRLIKFNSDSAK